jgi:hypothetical protein
MANPDQPLHNLRLETPKGRKDLQALTNALANASISALGE